MIVLRFKFTEMEVSSQGCFDSVKAEIIPFELEAGNASRKNTADFDHFKRER
jgi:hypothetical protein